MPLAEDQHPVGDLRPGGEHEPFRIGIRAGASGRGLRPTCRPVVFTGRRMSEFPGDSTFGGDSYHIG